MAEGLPPVEAMTGPTGGRGQGEEVVVVVEGLGAGGVGVGRLPSGKVVFLRGTVPGDRVQVRILLDRKKWAVGEVLGWRERGGGWREPPCPLYWRCGGCALQHLEYRHQVAWKGRVVGDALRRIGGVRVEDPEVKPSPREFHYRSRFTVTLRRLPGGGVVAGFRERDRPGRVLDVGGECLLPRKELMEVWVALRAGWGEGASRLPAGRELRLTLRWGEGGAALVIRGGRGDGDPEGLLSLVPGLASLWREGKGEEPRHLAGGRAVALEYLGERVEVEGGAFVQVNLEAAAELYGAVLEVARKAQEGGARRVVDAYGGIGILGRKLAEEGWEVVGVEADPLAVRVAKARGGPTYRVVEGRVEEVLGGILPADLVVLNPPRGGVHPRVLEALAAEPPRRVIYVSCDPATLARDLRRLAGAFQLESVRSFDLFPQTAHVETLAVAVRKGGF